MTPTLSYHLLSNIIALKNSHYVTHLHQMGAILMSSNPIAFYMAPSLLVRGSHQRRSSPASSPSKLALAFSIPPGYSFCMSIYSCPKPLHFPESHLFGCHLCFGFWLRSPPFALPVKKHHPLQGGTRTRNTATSAFFTRSTYPALSLIFAPDRSPFIHQKKIHGVDEHEL